MQPKETLLLNGKPVEIGDERNLLELIRGASIDLPTFCYHSELSVYGACRLCIVEIEGMGVVTSRSVKPVEDVFSDVWPEAVVFLENNTGIEAKSLIEHIQRQFPGRFKANQLRSSDDINKSGCETYQH